jgi:hypothetical protein
MRLLDRIRRDDKAMMLLNTYCPNRAWLRPQCWSCGTELFTVRKVAEHSRSQCPGSPRQVPQSREDYDDWIERGKPVDVFGHWIPRR